MNITDVVNRSHLKWMDTPDGDGDIVVSSRVRLARNINKVPFPHLLDQGNGEMCMRLIRDAWQNSTGPDLSSMDMAAFDQLPSLDRHILAEKHLISPVHADSNSPSRAVLVNEDGSLSAMINEEDHLRIQCMLPGLNLSDSYTKVRGLDNELEQSLDYAFDENWGYLTSCPTNVGTGMRASVMMHLPAIQMTGQVNQILQNISQLGLAVRGLYGEGSEAIGNFFQISNQITLGQTEEDICNYLHTITEQIVEQERLLREKLQKDMKYQLEDKIGRAFGILSNARIISSDEALTLFSDVRLGVDMGILRGISIFALNELMIAVRPGHLQKQTGQDMDTIERDIKRAEVIKEKLKSVRD